MGMAIKGEGHVCPSPTVGRRVKVWRRLLLIFFVVGLIICCLPLQALAQGLAVSPGILKGENIPLGERVSFSEIVIRNTADTDHLYSISVQKPVTIKEGYEEIPNPEWIKPAISEIEIPAQSTENVQIWVRIPNNEANASKNYEGWVVVSEKAGGAVAVAAAVRILLSSSEYNPALPEEAPPPEAPPEETPPVEIPPVEIPPEGTPPGPPEAPPGVPLNWWLIGGIIAGVVIIGTGIALLARRRR